MKEKRFYGGSAENNPVYAGRCRRNRSEDGDIAEDDSRIRLRLVADYPPLIPPGGG